MSISVKDDDEFNQSVTNESCYPLYYDSPLKLVSPSSARRIPIKVLPTYIFNLSTKKPERPVVQERKSTPKVTTSSRPSSRNGFSDKKTIKKKSNRSISVTGKAVKAKAKQGRINLCEVPNLQIELEKLIRAVFRHCVVCPELKSELKRINADALLQHYAKYRLQEF